MKTRPHLLNLQADFDPLNPEHVSDPKCWLLGDNALYISSGINRRFRLHERANGTWLENEVGIWDISNDVA